MSAQGNVECRIPTGDLRRASGGIRHLPDCLIRLEPNYLCVVFCTNNEKTLSGMKKPNPVGQQ
jgi:hypothetical protein